MTVPIPLSPLPPLPMALHHLSRWPGGSTSMPVYTGDQMQEYAARALLASASIPARLVDRNDPAPREWSSIHHSGYVEGWNACLDARAALATLSQAEPLCMCKDRPLSKCPGEWEPGCDLGANEKFVKVAADQMPETARTGTLDRLGSHSGVATSDSAASTERLVREDGWYSLDGGLSYRHPAPNAAAPLTGTGTTHTVAVGSARSQAPEASVVPSEPIEIRLNDDGTLDEVVGGRGIHLEQMSPTHWWMAVYEGSGEARVTVNFHARGKISANVEREGAPAAHPRPTEPTSAERGQSKP